MANNPATTKKLVATSAVQYYGTGIRGAQKALSTRYFDNSIFVSIHSQLPQNMQVTGGPRYDYKNGIEICLKPKTAKSFSKVLKKARSAIAENEAFESMAIPSGVNIIEVSDGSKFNLEFGLTICIYTNVSNKITDTYDVFQFINDEAIVNYDMRSGDYSKMKMDTDVELLIDQLHEFAKGANNAAAHFIMRANDFNMKKFANNQLEIMKKLGISFDQNYSRGTSSWNSGSGQGNVVNRMSSDDIMDELDNM